MSVYGIIITDVIVFSVILFFAYLLSNLYPGKFKETSTNKGGVSQLEVKILYRRVFQAIYVLAISLVFEGLLTLLINFAPVPSALKEWSQIEELHHDAWLIFWAFVFVLFLVEYRYRSYYFKAERTAPISPLIFLIVRSIILFGATLWIAKYVLGWHGVHILVSATALTAIVGFALKGTIGDLLSGISLHLSHAVIPSHWISIPTLNVEGEVILTNWRETRLRNTGGHIFVVPNSILASVYFHNMSWPDNKRRHALNFVLMAENDPETVEKALLEAVKNNPSITSDPKPPQVIIKQFMDFGVHYQLRVWSHTFHDPSSMEDGIYRAAWKVLNEQGIKFLPVKTALVNGSM